MSNYDVRINLGVFSAIEIRKGEALLVALYMYRLLQKSDEFKDLEINVEDLKKFILDDRNRKMPTINEFANNVVRYFDKEECYRDICFCFPPIEQVDTNNNIGKYPILYSVYQYLENVLWKYIVEQAIATMNDKVVEKVFLIKTDDYYKLYPSNMSFKERTENFTSDLISWMEYTRMYAMYNIFIKGREDFSIKFQTEYC